MSGDPVTVESIKYAAKGKTGWTDASSSFKGSCVRQMRLCGPEQGECFDPVNITINCYDTNLGMQAEFVCVGTGGAS